MSLGFLREPSFDKSEHKAKPRRSSPELGISKAWGSFSLLGYIGVWGLGFRVGYIIADYVGIMEKKMETTTL